MVEAALTCTGVAGTTVGSAVVPAGAEVSMTVEVAQMYSSRCATTPEEKGEISSCKIAFAFK